MSLTEALRHRVFRTTVLDEFLRELCLCEKPIFSSNLVTLAVVSDYIGVLRGRTIGVAMTTHPQVMILENSLLVPDLCTRPTNNALLYHWRVTRSEAGVQTAKLRGCDS